VSPRPRTGHLRRPQLLAAAAEVIAERGFAETRTSDVAERAGVSAPNVLYYFESKDALLQQALEWDEEQYWRTVDPALEGMASATEKIAYLLESLTEPPEGPHGWTLWIESWAQALHSPVVRDFVDRGTRRLHDMLALVAREGIAAGEFDARFSPEEFSLALVAMMDGLMVNARLGTVGVTADLARSIGRRLISEMLGCELPPDPGRRAIR
jgi:AcrR family transcriptional regulator